METKTETEAVTEQPAEKENKRTSAKEIIAHLAEKFPACFSVEGPAKPLKIGVFQELAARLEGDEIVSKTRLRQALRHYTSSWRYLKAIKVGAQRIDIDGNEVAEIDQEQADHAAKSLKESQEKFGNKNPKDSQKKKPYKGKTPENKGSHAKSNAKDKAKYKTVSASKRAQSKPAAKLKPVDASAVNVGKAVKVQLGNAPMDAVITEISGNDISVQLSSGMVVKTQVKNIYIE
ncbi:MULTISPECIES: RNA chaperone ProQ [Thalassotalea]|uniref:RNA chaperone ProQ n=1 Tax=Thalassotalea TaxID=1518149 RepID=UPI0009442DD6|nr:MULTISPECIES: RNA chaperone ProQ [Thalassotalea]OKY25464.1 RNA chaperone ProQ [Thalassotalea sp. PP2-459]